MTNKAILIVDDEIILAQALRAQLRGHFGPTFSYAVAGDAEEGLAEADRLAEEGITLVIVISDWLMPGMRGDEFLQEMKRRHPDIATVMVTGQADEAVMERVRRDPAIDAVFRKPWKDEELIAEVQKYLG